MLARSITLLQPPGSLKMYAGGAVFGVGSVSLFVGALTGGNREMLNMVSKREARHR